VRPATYASDTEVTNGFRARRHSQEILGGGFKDKRPRWRHAGVPLQPGPNNEFNPPMPKDVKEDVLVDVTNGNSFSYFCPKRFNRYPRFTIFFKKDFP
jgi:hypothetical protein